MNEGIEKYCRRIELVDNGFKVFMLYDSKMSVIKEAFIYLNKTIRRQSYATRRRKAFALTFLYFFLEENDISIEEMSNKECSMLEECLRDSQTAQGLRRTGATIQNYFSVFRDYVKLLGIKEHPLLDHHVYTKVSSLDGLLVHEEKKHYTYQVKASRRKYEDVPKYISFEEYQSFLKLATANHDSTAIILVTLMFIYGLRIGECLGLTVEDITHRQYHGKMVPVLILRNRKTDKDYQNAKTRMHIGPNDTYDNPDYIQEYSKDPFSRIVITEAIYNMLIRYIDETSTKAAENYPTNYCESIADIVSKEEAIEQGFDENHYVFLNSFGRPLSDQAWNKREKQYFKQLEIELDSAVRADNLNHRWRHGTAMFLLREYVKPDGSRMALTEVQDYLRHTSISSTLRYINPTIEDQSKTKQDFQDKVFEQAPELKEMIDTFVENMQQ